MLSHVEITQHGWIPDTRSYGFRREMQETWKFMGVHNVFAPPGINQFNGIAEKIIQDIRIQLPIKFMEHIDKGGHKN